ncbi:hypothetical protein Tco_0407073 [Tanacetum coccineum]
MADLKFADTHNLVAFLSKPAESEGFEQIVDFLNANPIRYALTINPTIYISCIEQFWSTVKAKTVNGEVQLHALVDGKKIIITESTMRRDLQLEDAEGVDYEVVHKERGNSLVRAATTASSLETEQNSGDTIAQTMFENVSKLSNDLLLAREKTKTTQQNEIASLKKTVKKLEQKKRLRTHGVKRLHKVGMSRRVVSSSDEEDLGEDASKQGRRINAIDANEDITLVNVQDDADNEIFNVDALTGDEVFVEQEVAAKDVKGDVIEEPSVPVGDVSALIKVSTATTTTVTIPTPRKEIVITELGTPIITRSSQQPSHAEVQDKGKGKMIEPEPVKPNKKDADHELAQRLQAEEQEELSVEEKATLFQQLLEKRRKHFAAKRVEEQRNKPPTQAQQRKIMCTYLKNMEGKKQKDLKNKSFDSIQKMFDRAFKRVNTFVDFKTNLVEGSSKRAGEELEQESTKKQKVDEDKDTVALQNLIEVILDEEEVAIDDVPLATKPPTIVD